MTKKKEHRYMDSKKTVLKTANNLYDHSVIHLNQVLNVQKECTKEKAAELFGMIYSDLKESLLFGNPKAAFDMASMHASNWLQQEENGAKLFVYIGDKLGEPRCQKLLLKMGDFSGVKLKGDQWLKAIEAITKKHPNLDTEITLSEAVFADKQLALHCKQVPDVTSDEAGPSWVGSCHMQATSSHSLHHSLDTAIPTDDTTKLSGAEASDPHSTCCVS